MSTQQPERRRAVRSSRPDSGRWLTVMVVLSDRTMGERIALHLECGKILQDRHSAILERLQRVRFAEGAPQVREAAFERDG